MAADVAAFLKKGAVDTLFQLAATTGVRFALVLSIFVLSRYVGAEAVATYDLFIISTSILLILLTFGLDSGLSVVAMDTDGKAHGAAIWLALGVTGLLFLLLYWPLKLAMATFDLGSLFGPAVFNAAYLYAGGTAVMTLVFAYFRWAGRALTASIIISLAHSIGFVVAGAAFASTRTVDGFIWGLLAGSAIGAAGTLIYLNREAPLIPLIRQHSLQRDALVRLINIGWPFGVASLTLIARRVIDRGVLVAIGASNMLGGYALVSRAGETAAFFLALPAMGLAPIILSRHAEPAGARIARLLYGGYLLLGLVLAGLAGLVTTYAGAQIFPAYALDALPLLVALIIGNLFFSESTVAGFGFVIAGRTGPVAYLSVLFIIINLAVALPLVQLGYGLRAVAAGFLIGAFVHSTIFITLSERHHCFGYPLRLITTAKLAAVTISLWSLFG
jgi:O-antigen/teichoic acid export membrane protein